MAIVIILLILGGVVWFLIWLINMMAAKRSKAFETAAPSLGLTFDRGPYQPGGGSFAQTSGFTTFNQGHTREIRNVLRGKLQDINIQLFDYSYTVGSGKTAQYYNFTAAMLGSAAGPVFPSIALYPEGMFSKLASVFGGQDIDFAEFPVFSKRFVLKSPDENTVRAMIDQPTAAFFEAHTGITVYAAGRDLVYYRLNKRMDPQNAQPFVDEALDVYRNLAAAAARVQR